MAGRKHGIAGGIALALISLLLAFAIPEGLLRLFMPGFGQTVFGGKDGNLPGLGEMVELTRRYQETRGIKQPPNFLTPSDLLWSLVPGYRGEITRLPIIDGIKPTWRLAINEAGLRGDPPTESAGVYRVLCLGDSITFGDKLDQSETYPAALGRLLRERWPGKPVEVVNAGVPGYSSLQGLKLWRRLESTEPAVVIVAFGFNDAWPSRVTDRESLPEEGDFLGSLRSLLRKSQTYNALRAALLKARAALRTDEAPAPGGSTGRRVSTAETEANVRTILRGAHARGIFAIVAHFAFGHDEIAGALARAARKEGAPFLDADALLKSHRVRRQAEIAETLGLLGRCPQTNRAGSGIVPRVRMATGREADGPIVAKVRGLAPKGALLFPLNDDGKGCDERAGDGVHSRLIPAPPGRKLHLVFAERRPDGTLSEEFHGFPLTWREMTTGRGPDGGAIVAPVETYNRFSLMSEAIHPDAEGARIIAEALADLLVKHGRNPVRSESALRLEGRGHA